jgi:hypothetical protein
MQFYFCLLWSEILKTRKECRNLRKKKEAKGKWKNKCDKQNKVVVNKNLLLLIGSKKDLFWCCGSKRKSYQNGKQNKYENNSNTGYFTSDNEPDGTENATHNTFAKLTCIFVF